MMFSMKYWWLRLTYRGPKYSAGTVVCNRYEPANVETLKQYCGPYFGYDDNHKMIITETWKTTNGAEVSVGYFWLPVTP